MGTYINRTCFSPNGKLMGLLTGDSNSTNHKNETAGYEDVAIHNTSLICFAFSKGEHWETACKKKGVKFLLF